MKKNIIIILLVFIIPMITYAIMSARQSEAVAQTVAGQPQVIKFSSKLCIDCKKIKACFDDLKPKYQNKISFIEYDVQSNDKEVSDKIDKYGITLVPTLIYINENGKEVRRTEGYVEKNTLEKYFKELLKEND